MENCNFKNCRAELIKKLEKAMSDEIDKIKETPVEKYSPDNIYKTIEKITLDYNLTYLAEKKATN